MTDLYDIAKPVRDAGWQEVLRCLDSDASDVIREGHHLGTHLQALIVADCSRRFRDFSQGQTAPPAIFDIYVIAVAQLAAQLAAHVAASCRPIMDGKPLSLTASGQVFLQKVAHAFFNALAHQEAGLNDFNISFQRNADGTISPEPFDFRDALAKGGASDRSQ